MIELDDRHGNVREREPRELEPGLRRRRRRLVAGIGDDEDDQLVEPELGDRRSREGDVTHVRRIEDAPEDAYCHSSSSSPTSTCVPGPDPETAKCLLELLGRRRGADHPIAAIGAEDPKARAASRARRVLEKLGNSLVGRGLHGRDATQLEERMLQLLDPAAGRARGRDDAARCGYPSTVKSGTRSRRSTLFSTTS